ncbi:MAG: AhpC/TSA family [Dehalococcoidia bacterium]|nr:AhpC/TSA family [Dehalococcoidia bacterium]
MIRQTVTFLAFGLAALLAGACGGGEGGPAPTPTATPPADALEQASPDTSPGNQDQVQQAKRGSRVGDLAPPFAVTTTAGERVSLASLQGKPFVLYFFATW